jgi:hypothetical protein
MITMRRAIPLLMSEFFVAAHVKVNQNVRDHAGLP